MRIVIAGIFIVSAVSKLLDLGSFEITLLDLHLFADRLTAAYFSRILIGIELGIGLLYLQPFYLKKIVIPFTILVLIVFSGYLVYLSLTGNNQDCGCFGTVVKMSPRTSLVKNILLLVPMLYMYVNADSKNEKGFIPLTLFIGAIAGTFLSAPVELSKNFLFQNYTNFIGEGKVDLSEGNKLVAVLDLGCEHCQTAAAELGLLQHEMSSLPKIYALFYSDGSVSPSSFDTMTSTHFPYHMISVKDFFKLIGTSPPRMYWLENGRVKKYWDENFSENLKKTFQKK